MNRKLISIIFVLILLVMNEFPQSKTNLFRSDNLNLVNRKSTKLLENTRQSGNYNYRLIQYKLTGHKDNYTFTTGHQNFVDSTDGFIVTNSLGGWGYFNLSLGIVRNLKPTVDSNIWKYGISVNADLNYQVGNFYSFGFLIGYNEISMKNSKYLESVGLNSSNFSTTGGKSYQLILGGINRFWFFPSSFVSPVISLFGGYENLIVYDIMLNKSGTINKVTGFTKSGFLFAGGVGLKFSTGEKNGFLLSSDYNWFFNKKIRYEYLTFHFGYILSIN
jgi:hypothetical protein